MKLSPAELRLFLRYDAETGKLFWLPREGDDKPTKMFNAQCAGKEALRERRRDGYLAGRVYEHMYLAHRVAFAIAHGRWPICIDHIDHDRANNRLNNLREVTQRENTRNTGRRSDNTSGATGVYRTKQGRWTVQVAGEHIGTFIGFDEACARRKEAAAERGYHPNHGAVI